MWLYDTEACAIAIREENGLSVEFACLKFPNGHSFFEHIEGEWRTHASAN